MPAQKNDSPHADAELTRRIQSGDEQAFRALYERYHRRLYGFALTFVKSGMLAEEAVQEVFLRLWEHREDLQADRSLKSYLFSICKNHVLNVLRRASREKALREEVLRSDLQGPSRPDEEVIHAGYYEVARRAIESLPPRRREIFEKCRREGRSYREVARVLGISTGTVSDHMVKANRHLKQYLGCHTDLVFSVLSATALSLLRVIGSGLAA